MVSTVDRKTTERAGKRIAVGLFAAAVIPVGTMAAINATGWLVPATADNTLSHVGLFRGDKLGRLADNLAGATNDITGIVEYGGAFRYNNSAGGDEIFGANRGQVVFVVDNDTVALTSNGGARPVAGTVVDVDSDGVFVQHTTDLTVSGGLAAANNLSDVSDAAASRGNLGIREHVVIARADLIAASAEVYAYVHRGPDATIEQIDTRLTDALAVGDATITPAIDGVGVTDGVVTIAQAGSAAGDLDTATPSALNVMTDGQVLTLTVGDSNTAAVFADISLDITY